MAEDILEKTEQALLDELNMLSDDSVDFAKKTRNLAITDRKIKVVNAIISVENLKERKYMNRTQRIDAKRKLNETKE